MQILNKKQTPIGLVLVLVLVLAICPRRIKDMYETVLGRMLLISIATFCALHNVLAGLLVVLILIIASNMFLFEGFKEGIDDETKTTAKETVKETVKDEIESKCVTDGCDRQSLTDALKSLNSNTIPIDTTTNTDEEVEASTENLQTRGAPI